MAWTACGTIQLSRDWQYTKPITEGTYFRVKHTEAKKGALFAIAQCEVDANGYISIGDTQVLEAEKGINDVVKLPKGVFTERRIALKRFDIQPSLEQQIRELFLPNFLVQVEQELNYIKRNSWSVDIEVSDYIDFPATGATDPSLSSLVLLCPFETDFSDTKGHGVTSFSNASISNAQSRIGNASAYFDGNGSYLSITSDASLVLGTNDFKIETWIRPEVLGGFIIFDNRLTANSGEGFIFYINGNTGFPSIYTVDNYTASSGTPISLNSWQLVTYSRTGNTHSLFLDDDLHHSFNLSANFSSTSPILIGKGIDAPATIKGYLDNLKIAKF